MAEDKTLTPWKTQAIGAAPRAIAPDGSTVHVLSATTRGSMIRFALSPGRVSRAVAHQTVEEIWYVVAGTGRLWRRLGEAEEVTELAPGMSLTIPTGASFQFRNDGDQPLDIVAVTMPPWPGDDEALRGAGLWQPAI